MATVTSAEIQREPEYRYTIVLSEDEAEVLLHVLELVGGSPRNSPRRHTQDICDGLRNVWGKTSRRGSRNFPVSGSNRGIHFKDYGDKDEETVGANH